MPKYLLKDSNPCHKDSRVKFFNNTICIVYDGKILHRASYVEEAGL